MPDDTKPRSVDDASPSELVGKIQELAPAWVASRYTRRLAELIWDLTPSSHGASAEALAAGTLSQFKASKWQSPEARDNVQGWLVERFRKLKGKKPSGSAQTQDAASIADPIEHYRGEFVHEATDLVVRGAGMDFAFHRTYRHQTVGDSPVGARWDHGYNMALTVDERHASLATGGGRSEEYLRHQHYDDIAGCRYYVPPDGLDATLEADGPDWLRRSPDGVVHRFTADPNWSGAFRLERVEDRWGNYLAFTYTTHPSGVSFIDRCEVNHPERWVQFAYDQLGHLIRLQDHAGRAWHYRHDAHGDLIGVTTPATPDQPRGATTRYTYTSSERTGQLAHLMLDIIDAGGRHYLRTEYGVDPAQPDFNRVIRQRIGTGVYRFRYQPVDAIETGLAEEDRPSMECWVQERNGHQTLYVYNAWGSLLRKSEPDVGPGHAPRRAVWRFRYNRDGVLVARRTPEGCVQQQLTGRDHFLKQRSIARGSNAELELWRDPKLTAEVRRGFTRVLTTVQRAELRPGDSFAWGERWGDLYGAPATGDRIVKVTYEPTFGQVLTTSDPRTTTKTDPDASEPSTYDDLLTTYVYDVGDPARGLLEVHAPIPTLPDGAPGGAIVTKVIARDARGRVELAEDAAGVRTQTEYLTGVNEPRDGFTYRVVVDPTGLALTTEQTLDALGRATHIALPRAVGAATPGDFVIEQDHDALDRVIATRSAAPVCETRTRFEPAGKPVEVQTDWADPAGSPLGVVARRYRYDEEHHLRRETYGSDDARDHHRIARKYNAAGLKTLEIAANNKATIWRYDSRDQLAKVIRGPGVGESVEVFVRDRDGRVVEHRSAEGRVTRTVYDAWNQVVEVTDALGNVVRTSYDAGGRPTVVRVFEWSATTALYTLLSRAETVYDEVGRAVKTIGSLFETAPAAVTAAQLSTAYESGVVGTGVETWMFHDAMSRVVKVVDPVGNETTTRYDAAGRAVEATDPTGNQVFTTYDAHGNAIRVDRIDVVRNVAGAESGQEVFTSLAVYDARDRKVVAIDGLGNVTAHAYDSLGRLVRTTDPLGNITEVEYDVYGNAAKTRQLRTSTGDGHGETLSPRVVQHEHDRAGLVTARIDALGRRTAYRYDKQDRVVEQTLPDGEQLTTSYDRDSLVTAVRDAHGVVTRTDYDALARPARIVIDPGDVEAGVTIEGTLQIDRSYDALGRELTAANEASSVVTTYDSLGRTLVEATTLTATAVTFTIAREYDAAGRRASLTYPDGRRLSYTHDAAGRLRTIQHAADGSGYPGAAGLMRTIASYAYAGSRLRATTYANGTSTTWKHDARGGVVEVLHTGTSGTILRVQQLRDGARAPRLRYQAMGATIRHERLGYDSQYQLAARLDIVPFAIDVTPFGPPSTVPVGTPSARQSLIDAAIGTRLGPTAPAGAQGWTYDLTGNRDVATATTAATTNYSVDSRDRYASIAGVTRTYDRAGNLTFDGTHSYIYDGLRRLVRVVRQVSGSITTVVRYDYDPTGRRITEDRPGAPLVTCCYDGPDRIADYRDGTCVGQYVHGPGVDDPVELAAAGEHHTYHLDPQGSVRALSDATGVATAHLRFDPFGNALNFTGGAHLAVPGTVVGASTATQPFGHASRPFDAATSTYDARARVYVPAMGRFLQRDPAGPIDGHLYSYAGNHPLAFGDPSGMARRENASSSPADEQAFLDSLPPVSAPNNTLYVNEGPLLKQWQSAMDYMTDSSNPRWARGVSGALALAATPVAAVEEGFRGLFNIPFATHNLGTLIGEHTARAKLAYDNDHKVAATVEGLRALSAFTTGFTMLGSLFVGGGPKGSVPVGTATPLPRAVVIGRGPSASASSGTGIIARDIQPIAVGLSRSQMHRRGLVGRFADRVGATTYWDEYPGPQVPNAEIVARMAKQFELRPSAVNLSGLEQVQNLGVRDGLRALVRQPYKSVTEAEISTIVHSERFFLKSRFYLDGREVTRLIDRTQILGP
jgi:RHS repeat-associated protein